ncbi:ABC transporter permease [Halorientalis pallida]|uniref:ABC transporter permease n=1 Tax=Halorientalis pallida TaxID=2479928 RepID=A0A498KX03_9EURY|nr:ABC transporter permease [Halorientalis pallida]RXK50142.1 ABC transporter permease [Halorientalis pallida]
MRRFLPSVQIAWRNLSRTKVRALLAAVTIVIGVVAVASLGILGATLRDQATRSLGDIGNQVVVTPAEGTDTRSLSARQLTDIERVARDSVVVPVASAVREGTFGTETKRVQVHYFGDPPPSYEAADGQIPEPLRGGALVGTELGRKLDLEPGNTITVNGTSYRVRALVKGSGSAFSPISPQNAVILPRENHNEYSQVVVIADSSAQANETATEINASLNTRRNRVVDVQALSSFTERIDQFFGFLNAFLMGLGAISLVVAGVSILNVMLMSTIERREEIGVLRAVGYQKRHVLRIVLAEALLLGIGGSLIGVVLSFGIGTTIAFVALDDATAMLAPYVAWNRTLGAAFGIGTSIVSGLYPAWKAANERPVDAIQG